METQIELTPEQRITRALGRMPYLPLVTGYSTSAEPERLAHSLEGLAEELARIAHENHERDRELEGLNFDIAAVRRVLGIGERVEV